MNSNLRSALLLGAATVAAVSLAAPASAQQAMETVVVTGSHIVSANLISASPVIEATAQDIQIQGVTKMEDLLNQMPQVFAGQNATVSNGASGTSEVNLRGLGCDRTLVLIDGRRMPYGTAVQNETCPDLNQIPTQLVERVDVLSGGASAVYGSDAVSGVVNFVMKHDFEGFQAEVQWGIYQHDNSNAAPGSIRSVIEGRAATNPSQFKLPDDTVWVGMGEQVSAIMGVSSANGKGNIEAYFSYRHNQPILQKDFDYSACALGAPSGVHWTCGGSSTSYPGRFTDFSTFNYTINSTTGNTFRNFSSATDQYNYGPLNYYQRPDNRYAAGVFGHYQAAPYADLYTQVMYMDYSTIAQIAPSGDFGNTFGIYCGNPLLSATEASQIGCTPTMITNDELVPAYILRRNVEGGGRQSTLRNTSFRSLFGVKGDLGNFNYDINGAYSHVESKQIYLHDFSVTRLTRALDVIDDGSGNAVCRSVVDGTDPNCVPWDIFKIGGVTQAALDYLQIPLVESGAVEQLSLQANFGTDLTPMGFVSPWAKTGVQLAFGAEYRQDSIATVTDTSFSTADGAGQGGPTLGVAGAVHVAEGYVEANVPLIEGASFAKSMTLDVSYRYSAYDRITTNTYGGQANWVINDDVHLRGTYQRAVRAPNVIDEYLGQGFNLTSSITVDPCGPGGYATLSECQRTPGAGSATWYHGGGLNSPANQYNFLQGGNPNLQAEKADSVTIGFVLTPQMIPGLTTTVDWFDVALYNNIGAIDPANVLYACYTLNNAGQCANIHRTVNGLLWLGGGYIDARNTNIGSSRTSGVDFTANYQFDLGDVGLGGAGAMVFDLKGTWLNKLTTDSGVGVTDACVGWYGFACGTPNPAWRHVLRATWETPWSDLTIASTWRFYGGVKQYEGNTAAIDYHWPSRSYFDVSAAMSVFTGSTLRVGINNMFDNDPPLSWIVGTNGNGNTYPQVYDAMGRYLFAALTVNM